jgi:HlyD family secretion protein
VEWEERNLLLLTMNTQESQTQVLEPTSVTAPRKKKPWLWILLSLLLVGGGIGVWRYLTPPKNTQPKSAAAMAPPAAVVETIALQSGNAVKRISLLGQIEPSARATIRSRTAGVVEQITVQAGDRVTRGTTIAILDNADQNIALAEAQARLAQERSRLTRLQIGTRPEIIAQRQSELRSVQAREQEAQDNLQRTTALVKEGAVAQRLLVEARAGIDTIRGERLKAEAALREAQAGPVKEEIDAQRGLVEAAQAAVNQAKLGLQRTRVTVASDGIVETRNVSVGDYVESNGSIATLIDKQLLDVFLELPEELSSQVTPGLPVTLVARALPQWQGRATVTGVVPAANTTSRRQMVRVRLNNPQSNLLPGMAVQGQLELRSNRPSFVVPRDALVRRNEKWLLYSVDGGKAKQYEVEMVADMGKQMAIFHPQLQPGQQIVMRGGEGLSDGAAIQVKQGK